MRIFQGMTVRHVDLFRTLLFRSPNSRNRLLAVFFLFVVGGFPASTADAETYLSYFYTPTDVIVFLPEAGTGAVIRDSAGDEVWSRSSSLNNGEVANVTGLSPAFYRVTSNKKIVLMAGDMISGSGIHTRSYSARDVDGNALGTKLYTYLRSSSEEDSPRLFVFSHDDSNTVTVWRRGEFLWEQVWTGTLSNGARQTIARASADHMMVTSTYPVTALVAGSTHSDDPGAHCVPSYSSGSFYGEDFETWLPGGEAYVFAFEDDTNVDLRNTLTLDPTPRASWDLNEGEVGSYTIPSDQSFAISVQADKPIVLCRMFQNLGGSDGMHYIPAKSGTMVGTEFVIDANDPIEVIAYEDGTTVEYTRRNGTVHRYSLDGGDHQNLPPDTAGQLVALKAVSVVSRATIGATVVPIPVTALDTAPGPPVIFAVRHYPPSPTILDTSVEVSWATDEPATSCISYRRNGGAWSTIECDYSYTAQHSVDIDISTFSANDVVEYWVLSSDKDSNLVYDDNNGANYSFTISDDAPKITVSRLTAFPPVSNDDPYTVNLTVENVGTATAHDIEVKEWVTGMISPKQNTSLVPSTGWLYELTIPVANLRAGNFRVVTYELVPLLYETRSTYEVGAWLPSSVSYSNGAGRTFSGSFSDPHTFSSSGALSWIKSKDYVVATNVGRLLALNTAAEVGRTIEEAARFVLARDAVIADSEISRVWKVEMLIQNSWFGRLGPIGFGGWRFLLFLGDHNVIPSEDVSFKCPAYSRREAPLSDNFYADVNRGDNGKPEVIVGRLPGATANLLRNQLRNSLAPFSNDRALLMSGTDGGGAYVDSINDVEDFMGPYTTTVKRHWKDIVEPARFTTFFADAPNTDLIIYRDHGMPQYWGYNTRVVNVDNLKTVSFGAKNPMVWSIACWTGKIDAAPSLAEEFLNQGASLFIGATEVSPRSPNNDFAHHLARNHSLASLYPTIGEVFKWAKWKVIDENISWWTDCQSNAKNKQLVYEYNLYGDPKRLETPLTKAAADRRDTAAAGEGPPPTSIELELPDYVVTGGELGVDHVTFPGDEGGTFEEDGQPIVPIYIHRVPFGPEYKISDVILTERAGLETGSGLVLPTASFEADDGAPALSSPSTAAMFPDPEARYQWRVEEMLDGSHVLILTVLPFHYDPGTTDFDFYRNHSFQVTWNQSDTAISAIRPSENVFAIGDAVEGFIDVIHEGDSTEASLTVDLLDHASGEVVVSTGPQEIGLDEGEASFDFGLAVEPAEPTLYLLRARLTNVNEEPLDKAFERVRVGSYSAIGEALAVSPDAELGFDVGDLVTATAWFQSACDTAFTGLARFRVIDDDEGDAVFEHAVELEFEPGETLTAGMSWDTTSVDDGTYRIIALLEYEGTSTEPMTEDISTRRDMEVALTTDRQVYDAGEKVVVWATITDSDGEPLEVATSLSLTAPDASVAEVPLVFLGNLGVYSGWFYLFADAPDGAYRFDLIAEGDGFHSESIQHFFAVGGQPPVADFEWSPETPEVGETVQFTDTSTDEPTSWSWSFGEGENSSEQNPAFAFGTEGEWEVTLEVTNQYGTDSSTRTVRVVTVREIFTDGFESGDFEAWSSAAP